MKKQVLNLMLTLTMGSLAHASKNAVLPGPSGQVADSSVSSDVDLALKTQYSCDVWSIFIIKNNRIVRNEFPTGVSLVTGEAARGEKCLLLSPNTPENIIPYGCIPVTQNTVTSVRGGILYLHEGPNDNQHSLSITLSNGAGRFDVYRESTGENVEVQLRSCKMLKK